MKKITLSFMVSILILVFCTISFATQIGGVTCVDRIGPRDDKIVVLRIDDPENPFVSIYITQVIAGEFFAAADPSNTSISCRLTGEIPLDEDGKQIINKKSNLDISSFRKSIATKVMKIARWYDPGKNVLVYVVYTTKLLGGSVKHSLSVVPLN